MNKLCRAVQGGFAVIFAFAIISVYIRGARNHLPVWGELLITAAAIGVILLMSLFYRKLKPKISTLSPVHIDRIFFAAAGAMLVIQLIFAIVLHSAPRSDLGYVDTAARNYAENWDTSHLYDGLPKRHYNYFVRYTNNQAIFVILSIVYRLCYLVTGKMPVLVPVLINTIGLNISVILMYFSAKKIFKDKTIPLLSGIMASGFSVFYTYTPFYYTDSLSMPFVMGSILLFFCGIDSKSKLHSALELMGSGCLLMIGYKIKGSVIILIPVFLLYLIVFTKKFNIKKHLKQGSLLITGCLIMTILSGAFISSFNLDSKETLNETKFPPTHWIMMGLKGRGGFDIDDFWYTVQSGNYDQKKQANIKEIKNRISDYGIVGMAKHLASKISWTWGDGTYFISYYIKKGPEGFLRNFICKSRTFKIYCSIYQSVILLSILFSFIQGAMSKRPDREIFLRILICGVFFFFVIWETRSRYLVNFSPVFIMMSAAAIRDISFAMHKEHTAGLHEVKRKVSAA
ncbi:glycosyltransferase family 39 protein [Porcipelethomonas sp.]|uniref:glycosyltransferase family 39 protein n=1 Tax=Porcipelethomonas sp. TaxID=2981675 RepID=UPI003EF4B3BE